MTPEQYAKLQREYPALEFPNWKGPNGYGYPDVMDWVQAASSTEVLTKRFAEVLAGIDPWRDPESAFFCDVPF